MCKFALGAECDVFICAWMGAENACAAIRIALPQILVMIFVPDKLAFNTSAFPRQGAQLTIR